MQDGKADVETNNSGYIGAATMKLKGVYTYAINGVDADSITGAASDAIISNKSNSTAITSLDDVAINTAGILNLDAATSPINLAANYIYICYGKDNQKTIELTRMTHGNKNTEERWYNAYNGSSWTGWMPLSRTGTYIGTCTTAAGEQHKIATVDDDFSLKKGVRVAIKFTNTNTFSSQTSTPITLNVNSTGDKNIYYGTNSGATGNTGTATYIYGEAGRYHYYIYDGTNWVFDGRSQDNNTTYSPQSLGFGYGTCTTDAATTAKVATLSSYNLVTNGYVSIKFTYDVPASATLNINSRGAKNIYYRGAAIAANIIRAGDIATFIYSGQYHLIGVDRTDNLSINYGYTNSAGRPNYLTFDDTDVLVTQLNYVVMGDLVQASFSIKFNAAKTYSTNTLLFHGFVNSRAYVFCESQNKQFYLTTDGKFYARAIGSIASGTTLWGINITYIKK